MGKGDVMGCGSPAVIGSRAAVAVSAAVVAVTSVAACTGNGGESSAASLPPLRDTPEPTRRPTTTDPNATTAVPATLGPQWMPGDIWPPPQPLGPQWMPGDIWPPPPACFPEANICISNDHATTSTTTTNPPTTTAAASTIPQDPEVQAAVLEAVGNTEAAYDEALRKPDDPSLVVAIEEATVEGSPAREEFVGTYEFHVAEGHWAVPDPEIPNSVSADGNPFVFADGMTAMVAVCHVSGDTLMGRNARGDEEVLADIRNAHLMSQWLSLVDGTWKLVWRDPIETFPEASSCESEQQPASSSPRASS